MCRHSTGELRAERAQRDSNQPRWPASLRFFHFAFM